MQIVLVSLEQLLEHLETRTQQEFTAAYPGAFLLAIGYVAVEDQQRRFHQPGGGKDQALTTAFSFGLQRRHQATPSHPLAGLAFFLQPTAPEQRTVTIGRSQNCQVTVPDESVSELHCQLEVRQDGVHAVDLGSTNGTSVNLKQLAPGTPHLVADEDTLSVGRYSFQLLSAQTLYDALSLMQARDDFDQLDDDA